MPNVLPSWEARPSDQWGNDVPIVDTETGELLGCAYGFAEDSGGKTREVAALMAASPKLLDILDNVTSCLETHVLHFGDTTKNAAAFIFEARALMATLGLPAPADRRHDDD